MKKRQHPICNTVGCEAVANWVHEGGIGASCDYHKNEWYTIEIEAWHGSGDYFKVQDMKAETDYDWMED